MSQDPRQSGPARPRFLAVLFDFGGTLDSDGEPSVTQFRRGYQAAGGRRNSAEFEEIFRESDRRIAASAAIRAAGFRATVDALSRSIVDLVVQEEHLDARTIAATVCEPVFQTAARNAHILGALQKRGVRTGVISNFTGNLQQCLAELGLGSVLDLIIDSAVVGIRKPDEKIITLGLDALGITPADALMVGDNPFADIRPAATLGMATCWLAPLSRPVPEGCTPTVRIASLGDLLEWFDAQRETPSAQRQTCTA